MYFFVPCLLRDSENEDMCRFEGYGFQLLDRVYYYVTISTFFQASSSIGRHSFTGSDTRAFVSWQTNF